MKIGIIGAGNMGVAIARGLSQNTNRLMENIRVADPNPFNLAALRSDCAGITTSSVNQEVVTGSDIVILAVKPWLMKEVAKSLTFDYDSQMIVSIAAGVSLAELQCWLNEKAVLFRLVPNTAISELASMTIISSVNASIEQDKTMLSLFDEMGMAMLMDEKHIPAATALTSCGIAYVLKYIQAAMQAGVEMGIYPRDAMKMVAQSVKGAAELILNNETHPSVEIDKVTTPGGITIKGINALDHAGFTSAIIKAMKESRT